jgi:hypothetical protein
VAVPVLRRTHESGIFERVPGWRRIVAGEADDREERVGDLAEGVQLLGALVGAYTAASRALLSGR